MAKGGGRSKGRPRKLDLPIGTQPVSARSIGEIAESSESRKLEALINGGGSGLIELEFEAAVTEQVAIQSAEKVKEDAAKKIEEG